MAACKTLLLLFLLQVLSVVSQARLSLGRRESCQIPIRLLYCVLSSRVPNEVGVTYIGTHV